MLREELYLHDIVKSIDDIGRFLQNVEAEKFITDEILQNAVLMKFVVIGEAMTKIPVEIREKYPEVKWKQGTGLRNVAAHAYFSVKWHIIWETATNDLRILHEQVLKILQNDFPDFELKSDAK
jgi:uncharacterized protein with HEPN domain